MIIDSHTHLNVEQFSEDLDATIQRAIISGVGKMLVVGFDYPTITKSLALSQKFPMIHSIIGWHPTEAGTYDEKVESFLLEKLSDEKVVALGEIGLDYYWMNDSKKIQEKVFRRQLAIAREMGLPFSIHTRDAIEDTYKILSEEKVYQTGGVMHSFSGDVEWMERFLDLGLHISLSGVVTFKKAKELHEVARAVPLEKLMVETDAPYLAPTPFRGKRNEPAYTRYVVEKIAELRDVSVEEIASHTTQNAHKLFKLGG